MAHFGKELRLRHIRSLCFLEARRKVRLYTNLRLYIAPDPAIACEFAAVIENGLSAYENKDGITPVIRLRMYEFSVRTSLIQIAQVLLESFRFGTRGTDLLACPSKRGFRANKYAPTLAREAIAECDQAIRYGGQLVPAILFLLTILFPIIPLSIFTIAVVALIGGSAFWKWTVILRAGFFKSFHLQETSQRGSGSYAAPARLDGWRR
ncbi:MAG: hypothetical protein VX955_06455 [Pseudomonadota bacterium]|nr:hypothetical protein [Pseudomonadota bacterium]